MRQLGGDDLLAVGGVLRQRLFTEDVLARLEGGQHIARVRGVGGGDDDGLDLGRGDERLAGLVGRDAVLCGHLVGGFLEIVRAGDDLCARHEVGQTADVIAADGAAADYTDFQHMQNKSFPCSKWLCSRFFLRIHLIVSGGPGQCAA